MIAAASPLIEALLTAVVERELGRGGVVAVYPAGIMGMTER